MKKIRRSYVYLALLFISVCTLALAAKAHESYISAMQADNFYAHLGSCISGMPETLRARNCRMAAERLHCIANGNSTYQTSTCKLCGTAQNK